MFRFASGLKMSSGVGVNGKGYLIFSGEGNSIKTNSSKWLADKYSDSERIWWYNEVGEFTAFKKSLDDGIFDKLMLDLKKLDVKGSYPAFTNSPVNEAKRLFPKIDNEANKDFISFVEFLNREFGFLDLLRSDTALAPYSEDIGPCMICCVNGVYEVPPEIPTLYTAPRIWSQLTWWINNHFSGPYPDDSVKFPVLNGRRFDWGLLSIDAEYQNAHTEGLVYFLLAKFIIIHDAWAGNSACDSLRVMIDLIKNEGQRPWRWLYDQ